MLGLYSARWRARRTAINWAVTLLATTLCLQLTVPPLSWAQTAGDTGGNSTPAPVNLDLNSTERTLTAGHLVQTAPVNIQVGETTKAVDAATMLTPAERLAVYQVVSTNQQSIQLSELGNAVGGSFTMGAKFSQYVSSVVIPQGVSAVRDFATASTLNLTGNLTNLGNLYAVSSNQSVTNAIINANNIVNQPGALLSSVVPPTGLAGLTNLVSNLDLTLNAIGNIVNAGTISSSGNLNLNAGGSITNALPIGVSGPSPVMQAFGSVNLMSAAGSIVNSGVISSLNSNVNLSGLLTTNLLINNTGGQIQAMLGAINIRDALFKGTANSTLVGGDWFSRQLNLHSGKGAINALLGQTTGLVNAYGTAAHVWSDSSTLKLGKIDLSGDPTFASNGRIEIFDDILVGESLAIVASNDIEFLNGLTIATRNGSGQGHDIYIVAGATIDTPNFPSSPNLPDTIVLPEHPLNPTHVLSPIHLSGPSNTGGNIEATGVFRSPTVFDASSTGSNQSGGNIVLVALTNDGNYSDGRRSHGGQILLPNNTTIKTSGTGSGVNGNVTLIAPAAGGIALTTGVIDTTGGTGGGGAVTVTTIQPSIDATFDQHGNFSTTGSGFSGPSTSTGGGAVIVNGAITSSGPVSIRAEYLSLPEIDELSVLGLPEASSISSNQSISIETDNLLIRDFSFSGGGGIFAGSDLDITSAGIDKDLNIINVGGTIASDSGDINITHTGAGKLFILNENSSTQTGALSATNGSVNITTDNQLVLTGQGQVFADTAINLTSTGSWVFAEQSQMANFVNLNSAGMAFLSAISLLNVSINSNSPSPDVTDGMGYNIFIDSPGSAFLDSNNVIVLSSGSFGTLPTVSLGVLTDSDIQADRIISIRDGSSVTGIASIATNGNSAYIGSMDPTVGLTFNSNVATSPASGDSGGLWLYSAGGITALNGSLSTAANAGSGGVIFAASRDDIHVSNLNSNDPVGIGTPKAGNISVATVNGSLTTSGITARTDQLGGADANGGDLLFSLGGNLLTTPTGVFATSFGIQNMGALAGRGGNVFIDAAGNITIGTDLGVGFGITSWGGQGIGTGLATGGGGNHVIISQGTITSGQLNTNAGGLSGSTPGPLTGVGNAGWMSLRARNGINLLGAVQAIGGIDGGDGGSIDMEVGNLIHQTGNLTVANFISTRGSTNGSGDAGTIQLRAPDNISTAGAFTLSGATGGNGHDIRYDVATGAINITLAQNIVTTSLTGARTGDIKFFASTGITTPLGSGFNANGGSGVFSGDAGTIQLIIFNGGLTTGFLTAAAHTPAAAGPNGNGGAIIIQSESDVNIGPNINQPGIGLTGTGNGHGGTLLVDADGDFNINLPVGVTNAGISAWGGIDGSGGGFILVQTFLGGNINVGQVGAAGDGFRSGGPAGPLTGTGHGGHIELRADGSVTAISLSTAGGHQGGAGGEIFVRAQTGSITVDNFITSNALGGSGNAPCCNGGDITLDANSGISVGDVITSQGVNHGNGGKIDLSSDSGVIDVSGAIDSSAAGTRGTGGNVLVNAPGGFHAMSINTVGGLGTGGGGAITGGGGDVIFQQAQSIHIDDFIDTSASLAAFFGPAPDANGNGGRVTLPADSIMVGSIRANGGDRGGNGGEVTITDGSVGGLTMSSFIDTSACECNPADGGGVLNSSGTAGKITVNVGFGLSGSPTFRAEGGASGGQGADISITVTGGDASLGFVSSSGQCPSCHTTAGTATAGKIDVMVIGGSVLGDSFRAEGGYLDGDGGNVTITSTTGNVQGTFASATAPGDGDAGAVNINAATGINFNAGVQAAGFGANANANNVMLKTTTGAVDVLLILAYAGLNGGNVTVLGPSGITVGTVSASAGNGIGSAGNAGNIRLISTGSTINLNGPFYDSAAQDGIPGDIIMVASGSVLFNPPGPVNDLSLSRRGATGADDAGSLHIIAGFDFTTNATGTTFQFGGKSAQGGDVDLTGLPINSTSTTGDGGQVTIVATDGFMSSTAGNIMLGPDINTFSTASPGGGGDITLLATNTISGSPSVDTSTENGSAGVFTAISGFNVTPTPLANQSFPAMQFFLGSPSTAGGNVLLAGSSIVTTTNCSCPGGLVFTAARSDSGGFNGRITLSNIFTKSLSGTGGHVVAIAGGQDGSFPFGPYTVELNGIIDTGDLANPDDHTAGNVSILARQPQLVGGNYSYTNGVYGGPGLLTTGGTPFQSTVRQTGSILALSDGAGSGVPSVTLSANYQTIVDGGISTSGTIALSAQQMVATGQAGPNVIFAGDAITIDVNNDVPGTVADMEPYAIIGQTQLTSRSTIDITVSNALDTLFTTVPTIELQSHANIHAHGDITMSVLNTGASSKKPIIEAFSNVNVVAGELSGSAPSSGVLTNPGSQILFSGDLTLISGYDIELHSTLGTPSSYIANGGNVRMEARGWDIYLSGALVVPTDGDLHIEANGGNVILLARNDIEGSGTNNSILARAAGTLSGFVGGAIEIAAGITDFNAPLLADLHFFSNRQPLIDADNDTKALLLNNGFDLDLPGGNLSLPSGSALFKLVSTGGGQITIAGSNVTVDGGALILRDPPDVDLQNWSISSFAPPLLTSSPPPPVHSTPMDPPTLVSSPPPPPPPPPPPTFIDPPTQTSSALPDPVAIPTDKTPPVTPAPPVQQQTQIQEFNTMPSQNMSFVATSDCGAFNFGKLHDTYVQGAVGSVFEVDSNKNFVLTEGRVFIGAGNNGITMVVGDETVALAPHTVALVDGRELKPVRVTVLDSPSDIGARISKNGTELASLKNGEEALIANRDIADEELIPIDGVDREYVGGVIQKVGMNVRKASNVPVKKILEKEPLLNCCIQIGNNPPLCHISWPYKQLVKKYGAVADSTANSSRQKAYEAPSSINSLATGSLAAVQGSDNALKPIVWRNDEAATTPVCLSDLAAPAVYRWQDDGNLQLVAYTPVLPSSDLRITVAANVQQVDRNYYRLTQGQILLQSDSDVRVDAPNTSVFAQSGTTAVVTVEKDLVRVLDLSDRAANSIRVVVGKNSTTLRPGQEVAIMSAGIRAVRELVTGDGIGRRRMRIVPTGNLNLVVNDFSVIDALGKHPMLKLLRASRDKRDKDILSDIMKVAAALSLTLDRSRGPYSSAE